MPEKTETQPAEPLKSLKRFIVRPYTTDSKGSHSFGSVVSMNSDSLPLLTREEADLLGLTVITKNCGAVTGVLIFESVAVVKVRAPAVDIEPIV